MAYTVTCTWCETEVPDQRWCPYCGHDPGSGPRSCPCMKCSQARVYCATDEQIQQAIIKECVT